MKGLLLRAMVLVLVALIGISAVAADNSTDKSTGKLRVYFIDVEGGQSTLFVTPAGESLLIDTGWPGKCSVDAKGGINCPQGSARDAERIVATAKKAGLSKIDYVLITHYHVDHVGGLPALAAKIPIGTFIDHGPNREMDKGITEKDYADYQKVLAQGKSKNIHAKPGDVLPIHGFKATVISADGVLIDKALPGGGGANEYCKASETRPVDQTENARSLGIEITFGSLKMLDLGDLTWDKEMQLMCPANKLGKIDVLIVSHHGWNQSSSPALVDAIHERVAIMDNGADKGGSTPVLQTFKKVPGLETLWQVHYSNEGGDANNTATEYIANPKGEDKGLGFELVGAKDGSFAVTNERTGMTKQYGVK